MAASIDLFVNNNLFENDINFTLEKLMRKLNNEIIIFKDNSEYNDSLKNKDFWGIYLYEENSVEEDLLKNGHIKLFRNNGMREEEIWMSKTSIMLWGDKFDMAGGWHSFNSYIKGIEEYNYHYELLINDIIEYSKLFESNKLVIFSGDFHQDILEELWHGNSIENVLTNKRWEIIDKPHNDCSKEENVNILYYKEWKPEDIFSINEWKKYFR